jgi:hypothetical protein
MLLSKCFIVSRVTRSAIWFRGFILESKLISVSKKMLSVFRAGWVTIRARKRWSARVPRRDGHASQARRILSIRTSSSESGGRDALTEERNCRDDRQLIAHQPAGPRWETQEM